MYNPHIHRHLNKLQRWISKEGKDTGLTKNEIHGYSLKLAMNFEEIFKHTELLYGSNFSADKVVRGFVKASFKAFCQRPDGLRKTDKRREKDPFWHLDNRWVGYMAYADLFARDLRGVTNKLDYLQRLGVNCLHLMPLMETPTGPNDGGYAVKNYQKVRQDLGSMDDLTQLIGELHKKEMILVMDLVLNHTSDEHKWAKKALAGDLKYQDFYFMYPDRKIPDEYEKTMPEVFPETAPGNFIYLKEIDRWVMSVFNDYQWDLNYANPAVFESMFNNLMFLSNLGADIVRLDATPFMWKKLGTSCQNLSESHKIVQLMRMLAEIAAPGTLFLAEAIVSPEEIIKYYGEGPFENHECDLAYNATLMALMWDALATKDTRLLNRSMYNLPEKPPRTTWINYARCHDDIGLGFQDTDIAAVGFDPRSHRQFLINYYTGAFEGSQARGEKFMFNPVTGDARISGTLASLAGLESALATGPEDSKQVKLAVDRILLLHAIMYSYGGIPMIFSGDELAALNYQDYKNDPEKAADNRWMHRPRINWEELKLTKERYTPQYAVFDGLRHLAKARKSIPLLADLNNIKLIWGGSDSLLAYVRYSALEECLVAICNFSNDRVKVSMDTIRAYLPEGKPVLNLAVLPLKKSERFKKKSFTLAPFEFVWLGSPDLIETY